MHDATLYPQTNAVLSSLQTETFLQHYYLAGGTALALQIGHRKSIDLDFFINQFPAHEGLLHDLSAFKPIVTQQAEGTLDVFIQDVKVSFLEYPYPLLNPMVPYRNLRLASVLDIACMKIVAISARGSKKDFVDLYFILKTYSLEQIFAAVGTKYANTQYQTFHLLKSLAYFTDAESDPDPDFTTPTDWGEVKHSLEEAVLAYTKSI